MKNTPATPLDISFLEKNLSTRSIGKNGIRHSASVTSTNDVAADLFTNGSGRDSHIVLAESQTRGRGRMNRHWDSPAGVGILASILILPEKPYPAPQFLTVMAALAAVEAIESTTNLAPLIQWPNDIVFQDTQTHRFRKAGGILVEVKKDSRGRTGYILGIGLNINHAPDDFATDIREIATSIAIEQNTPADRTRILMALLTRLDDWHHRLPHDSQNLESEWQKHSADLGKSIRLTTGGHVLTGIVETLGLQEGIGIRAADGALHHALSGESQFFV